MEFNLNQDFIDGLWFGGFFATILLVPYSDKRIIECWLEELDADYNIQKGDSVLDDDTTQERFERCLRQAETKIRNETK